MGQEGPSAAPGRRSPADNRWHIIADHARHIAADNPGSSTGDY
jgi:hypothetical protein